MTPTPTPPPRAPHIAMPLACSIPEGSDVLRVERDDYDEGDPQQHEDGRLQPLAAAAQLEARYLSLEDEDGEAIQAMEEQAVLVWSAWPAASLSSRTCLAI